MIQSGRRDARAVGNSRRVPIPILKGAAAWHRGDAFDQLDPRYTIEVPGKGQPIRRYDTKTGRFLEPGVEPDVGYIIHQFPIDHNARMKFAVKTLLGFGWRLFGEDLLSSFDVDTLRAYLSIPDYNISDESKILFNDPFLIGNDPEQNKIYRIFEKAVTKEKLTTIYLMKRECWLEWTVACLGYIVATIVVPLKKDLLLEGVPADKGILLTFERHKMSQEVIDALL